jgi:hypothetical protein
MWVHAGAPVVAERPMYFSYRPFDLGWAGGHDIVGTNAAANDWYFAEGTTRNNFEQYISLQNPGASPANVQMTFMKADGGTVPVDFQIGARSRYTVWVNPVVGPEQDVSTSVHSDQPIIAERPMYFAYRGTRTDGHDVIGATGPATQWFFAEGYAGSAFEQYLSIQNPGEETAVVNIELMMRNGDTIVAQMQVGPHSRSTSYVNALLGIRNFADAVAVHPYVSPPEWGTYVNYVNATLAANGGTKQLIATEIGWPSEKDDPAQAPYYMESEQARILGGDGLGKLWEAGVRKIWIYEDVDDAPGESWDGSYYGLFRNDGSAKPAWSQYCYWQNWLGG